MKLGIIRVICFRLDFFQARGPYLEMPLMGLLTGYATIYFQSLAQFLLEFDLHPSETMSVGIGQVVSRGFLTEGIGIETFLKQRQFAKFLEKGTTIKGKLLSALAGIISAGPIYAWYPMLKDLREKFSFHKGGERAHEKKIVIPGEVSLLSPEEINALSYL